ncbi:MAG: acyl-CoA dehydrogenase, partial [Rhodococcus sp. (in: high G+C Gram-positive bacteria)]
MTTPQSLSELFAIDTLLDAEEIAIRDTVRKMVDDRIRPHVGEWFEAAALPA